MIDKRSLLESTAPLEVVIDLCSRVYVKNCCEHSVIVGGTTLYPGQTTLMRAPQFRSY